MDTGLAVRCDHKTAKPKDLTLRPRTPHCAVGRPPASWHMGACQQFNVERVDQNVMRERKPHDASHHIPSLGPSLGISRTLALTLALKILDVLSNCSVAAKPAFQLNGINLRTLERHMCSKH